MDGKARRAPRNYREFGSGSTSRLQKRRPELAAQPTTPAASARAFTIESWTLSQSYYFGSVNQNPSHRVEIITGTPIDLMVELDAGAISKPRAKAADDAKTRPVSSGAGVPISNAQLEGYRLALLALLARLRRAAIRAFASG
jgi:hypothetical protein